MASAESGGVGCIFVYFEMMFVFSFFKLWNFLILTWNGPEFVEDSQFECAIVSGRYYEHWRLQRVVGRYYTKKGITRDTEAHLQPMPDTFSTKGCPCSARSIEFPHPNGELGSSKQSFFDILFLTIPNCLIYKKMVLDGRASFCSGSFGPLSWNGYCRYKILLPLGSWFCSGYTSGYTLFPCATR